MAKGGLADEASLAQRLICHSVSLELAYRPQPWGLFDTAQRLSGKPEDKAKDHDPILLSPHGPEMRSRHSCDRCFPLPGTLVKPQTITVSSVHTWAYLPMCFEFPFRDKTDMKWKINEVGCGKCLSLLE